MSAYKGLAAFLFLSVLVAFAAWFAVTKKLRNSKAEPVPGVSGSPSSNSDPRLAYPTPYRNVRPDVAYAGDDACASCHPDEAGNFKKHPMGRSAAYVAGDKSTEQTQSQELLERFDRSNKNPFQALGFEFAVQKSAQNIIHKEIRRDAHGQVVTELSANVVMQIGSGSQGRSYLVDRDGYLFQSPISWFTDTHSWGLSPGFGEVTLHFRRNITVQCLFCHINQFTPVANTAYRYVQPLPQQLTIGCERCHGPGQLHVARREAAETVEGTDDSIVNPADLEPTLREAVCQQCHLMGEQRIVRRKRSVFDYRPGLPLYLVFSTFVRPPQAVESGKFLSHVEQMYLSKCFRATSGPGKLGCISCHDPHCKPAPADRIAFYRSRCLNCHRILEDGGVVSGRLVSGKEANDRKLQLTTSHFTQPHHSPLTTHHSPEDDCISCHMPRRSSTSLAHAAVSDHRIIRWPGRDPELGPESRSVVQPAQIPLLYFHRDLRDPADPDVRRDLGLAMISKSRSETHLEIRHAICARAMPLLETALQDDPEDIDALEAKGFGLWVLDAPKQALATLEAVLAKVPAREIAREDAAQLATNLGLEQTAIEHWRQLLTANPWNPEAHYSLAKLLGQRQDWLGAIMETSAALRFDPTNVAARMLLVAACLKTGDQKRAHQEFATVERLQPPQLDKLREWFTAQERP